MSTKLPPLSAILAFDSFIRNGSVREAAVELHITKSAIAQQLRFLEEYTGATLLLRHSRNLKASTLGLHYHHELKKGLAQLYRAQNVLSQHIDQDIVSVSAMPSVLMKWLTPHINTFNTQSIRMEATTVEPESDLLSTNFRITYGELSDRFPHSRKLYKDYCFPVASPRLLKTWPMKISNTTLSKMPLIETRWNHLQETPPTWQDWFALEDQSFSSGDADKLNLIESWVQSMQAIESAILGNGVALAQASFVEHDIRQGRLVRLSTDSIQMPAYYYLCWGDSATDYPIGKRFLNWITSLPKPN